MCWGIVPPGQPSLAPIPGQSKAITVKRCSRCLGQLAKELQVVRLAVEEDERRSAPPLEELSLELVVDLTHGGAGCPARYTRRWANGSRDVALD